MPPAIVDSEDESDLEIEGAPSPISPLTKNSKSPSVQPTVIRGIYQASVQKFDEIVSKRPAVGDFVTSKSPPAKKRKFDPNDLESREVAINHLRGLAQDSREQSVAPQISDSLNDSLQVTQPSSVDAEEAIARDLPPIPSFPIRLPSVAPINELWLDGTLKHDFENHNPFMFEPSSTAPYDTAVQPLPVPFASEPPHISFEEPTEDAVGGLATAKSSETDQSSFPWSAYVNSQVTRSSGPKTDGQRTASQEGGDSNLNIATKGSHRMSQDGRMGKPSSNASRSGRLIAHASPKSALAAENDIWAMPESPDVLAPSKAKAQAQAIKEQKISTTPIPLPDLSAVNDPQVVLDALSIYSAKSSVSTKSSPQTTASTKAKKASNMTTQDSSNLAQAKKRKKSRTSRVVDDDDESTEAATPRGSRAQISRLSADPMEDGTADDASGTASRRSSKRRKVAGFSEESILYLQSMGFDENAAYRALSFTSGDVGRAAEMLLDRPDDLPAVVDTITPSEPADTPKASPKPKTRPKKASKGSPMVQINSFDASVNAHTEKSLDDLDDLQQLDEPSRSGRSGSKLNKSSVAKESPIEDQDEQAGAVIAQPAKEPPAAEPNVEAKAKKRGRGRPCKNAEKMDANATVAQIASPAAEAPESKPKAGRPTKSKTEQEVKADPVNIDAAVKDEDTENLAAEPIQDTAEVKPDPAPKVEVLLKTKAVTAGEKIKSTPGKTAYRVGLSRTTRIAPLLRMIRK